MARKSPRHPVGHRRCVSCRQLFDKAQMHRVVFSKTLPEPLVLPLDSPPIKVSGRSAYCCPSESCMNSAVKGKKLAKALKRPFSGGIVHVPASL